MTEATWDDIEPNGMLSEAGWRKVTRGRSCEGYRLCFVDGCWAYFANVPPTEVWGDDWNDAPHDCNAGEPYAREGQKIVKVAFDGPWEVVGNMDDGHWHCATTLGRYGYLSVQDINEGKAPWLVEIGYGQRRPGSNLPPVIREIQAGLPLRRFREVIEEADGAVYERVHSKAGVFE